MSSNQSSAQLGAATMAQLGVATWMPDSTVRCGMHNNADSIADVATKGIDSVLSKDIISSLPDALLLSIIEKVSETNCAKAIARCASVSKRFLNIAREVPALTFTGRTRHAYHSYSGISRVQEEKQLLAAVTRTVCKATNLKSLRVMYSKGIFNTDVLERILSHIGPVLEELLLEENICTPEVAIFPLQVLLRRCRRLRKLVLSSKALYISGISLTENVTQLALASNRLPEETWREYSSSESLVELRGSLMSNTLRHLEIKGMLSDFGFEANDPPPPCFQVLFSLLPNLETLSVTFQDETVGMAQMEVTSLPKLRSLTISVPCTSPEEGQLSFLASLVVEAPLLSTLSVTGVYSLCVNGTSEIDWLSVEAFPRVDLNGGPDVVLAEKVQVGQLSLSGMPQNSWFSEHNTPYGLTWTKLQALLHENQPSGLHTLILKDLPICAQAPARLSVRRSEVVQMLFAEADLNFAALSAQNLASCSCFQHLRHWEIHGCSLISFVLRPELMRGGGGEHPEMECPDRQHVFHAPCLETVLIQVEGTAMRWISPRIWPFLSTVLDGSPKLTDLSVTVNYIRPCRGVDESFDALHKGVKELKKKYGNVVKLVVGFVDKKGAIDYDDGVGSQWDYAYEDFSESLDEEENGQDTDAFAEFVDYGGVGGTDDIDDIDDDDEEDDADDADDAGDDSGEELFDMPELEGIIDDGPEAGELFPGLESDGDVSEYAGDEGPFEEEHGGTGVRSVVGNWVDGVDQDEDEEYAEAGDYVLEQHLGHDLLDEVDDDGEQNGGSVMGDDGRNRYVEGFGEDEGLVYAEDSDTLGSVCRGEEGDSADDESYPLTSCDNLEGLAGTHEELDEHNVIEMEHGVDIRVHVHYEGDGDVLRIVTDGYGKEGGVILADEDEGYGEDESSGFEEEIETRSTYGVCVEQEVHAFGVPTYDECDGGFQFRCEADERAFHFSEEDSLDDEDYGRLDLLDSETFSGYDESAESD